MDSNHAFMPTQKATKKCLDLEIKVNHYGLDTTNFKYDYSYLYKNKGKIMLKVEYCSRMSCE